MKTTTTTIRGSLTMTDSPTSTPSGRITWAVTIGIMGSLTQARYGNMKTVKVGMVKKKQNAYSRVVEFDNGYGASIISHDGSYGGDSGLFEVAVLHDDIIVYDTPVTHDTIGWLDFAGVAAILKDIEELPPRN
jgi:hypothetical protein